MKLEWSSQMEPVQNINWKEEAGTEQPKQAKNNINRKGLENNISNKGKNYSNPWIKAFWTYLTRSDGANRGFDVQCIVPRVYHVLARVWSKGQMWKGTSQSRILYLEK